jgi:hypothetical protein
VDAGIQGCEAIAREEEAGQAVTAAWLVLIGFQLLMIGMVVREICKD